MKKVLPLNADEQGLCRPLKAQYYKNGAANFLKSDGGTFAATGVIETMDIEKEPKIVSYTRSREDGSILNRHLNDVANTIHTSTGQGGNTDSYVSEPSFRIRKLTERECFRLMGVADTDINKIQASGVSRSQQYKMAGN